MIYLYTTEPDEGCHKVEAGIYGRPVHTYEQKALKAKGWKETVNELREEEGREEAEEEVIDEALTIDERRYLELVEKYRAKFGKDPHHKMKMETIQKKVDSDD